MLEVRLLGGFDVRLDREQVDIPSRPSQSLLAYLILTCGTRHRRERLAGLLWPESDETNARRNLRHALWRLRKAVGDVYIHADKVSVEFNGEADYSVDVSKLLNADVENGSLEETIEAMSVYGGELLPGFYENWVVLERERIRSTFERRVQVLLERLRQSERWADAIEWSERWIALGQAPEAPYRSMMIAYGALGDSAKVSVVYKRCEQMLRDELGVDPSPQTEEIFKRAVQGDFAFSASTHEFQRTTEQADAQAVLSLLDRWRKKDVEVLDVASLAIIHAAGDKHNFGENDFSYILHSTLHHGLDITPWIDQAASPAVAVSSLEHEYESYPRPAIRERIVEALAEIEGEDADAVLLNIVRDEDVSRVRVEASLSAAERMDVREVVDVLIDDIHENDSTSAMASLTAVADVYGIPEDAKDYPRTSVTVGVAQRRWKDLREDILRQGLSIGASGTLAAVVYGLFIPFLFMLAMPILFSETIENFTLPAWILSSVIAMGLIGGLQGLTSGFVMGIADTFLQDKGNQVRRYAIGSLSGLFYSVYLILFSMMDLLSPVAPPEIYIPVSVLYGLVLGATLAIIIPPLQTRVSPKTLFKRTVSAVFLFAVVTIPYTILVYQDEAGITILSRILFAIVYPMGIGLAIIRKERRGD